MLANHNFGDSRNPYRSYTPIDLSKDFSLNFSLNFFEGSNVTFIMNIHDGFKFIFKDNLVIFFKDRKFEHYKTNSKKRYKVIANWDVSTHEMTIFIDDKALFVVPIQKYFGVKSIYLERKEGENSAIWDVELNRYHKKRKFLEYKDYVKFKNNDYIIGKVVSLDNNELNILEDLGKYNIPFKNIEEIYFYSHQDKKQSFEVYLTSQQKIYGDNLFLFNQDG